MNTDSIEYCIKFSKSFDVACAMKATEELVQLKALLQPCGHPLSAVVGADDLGGVGTMYCSQCADDSLRANIAAGVEL